MRGARMGAIEPRPLRGPGAWAASLLCLLPVLVGFLLPAVILGRMAAGSGQSLDARYLAFVGNSLQLAGIAALATVAGAVLIGFRARTVPGRASRALVLGAGLGYAVPGGVIAVGLLVPFAGLDNLVDGWMRASFGVSTGLLFTGSLALLVLAYTARFMAIALNAYDAGLATVSPRMDAVARTLGRSPPAVLATVHLPILKTSVLTALLIVFVDVMKELPATLIMRPFDFDTLAVQAYRLASDERLAQAAVPSLIIAAIGLLPVILVCRRLAAREPGPGRALARVSRGRRPGASARPQPLAGRGGRAAGPPDAIGQQPHGQTASTARTAKMPAGITGSNGASSSSGAKRWNR